MADKMQCLAWLECADNAIGLLPTGSDDFGKLVRGVLYLTDVVETLVKAMPEPKPVKAPENDLLEACRALLAELEHIARNDPHFTEQGYGSAVLPSLFEQARAAIAKATTGQEAS